MLCFRALIQNEIELDDEELQSDPDNNILPMPIQVDNGEGAAGDGADAYVLYYSFWNKQITSMVKVVWEKAASPPHMDSLMVFNDMKCINCTMC